MGPSNVSFEALCYKLHWIVLWIAQWAMRGPMGLVGSVCPYIVSVEALCYTLHGIVLSTSVFTHISTHSHQYTPVSIEHRYGALYYKLHGIVLWIAQWAMRGPMGWV